MLPRSAGCSGCRAALLVVLLAGASGVVQSREYRGQTEDLLRLLAEQPWRGQGRPHHWDRLRVHPDLGDLEPLHLPEPHEDDALYEDDLRRSSDKRSAVATALNLGRWRRQPSPPPPALGKAVSSYVGVGVLNDVGTFFDSLRENLDTFSALSPEERSTLFQETPTVVHAQPTGNNGGGSSGDGGAGAGIRKLHALRPLRPSGNIRSYNRRSFVEADEVFPAANHHDPALLWTGLGR